MSVIKDTKIVTARGDILVSELRIGDEVLTDKKRWRPVTEIIPQEMMAYIVELQTEDGIVRLTEDHPVLTVDEVYVDEDLWIPVNEIIDGDYVVGRHGMLEVKDMDIALYEGDVYDLQVEEDGSYTTEVVVVRA